MRYHIAAEGVGYVNARSCHEIGNKEEIGSYFAEKRVDALVMSEIMLRGEGDMNSGVIRRVVLGEVKEKSEGRGVSTIK